MKCFRRLLPVVILTQIHFLGAQDFDYKPVADNVYAAIAKPTFRTNCNAAIFILNHEVVVVDSESKPSAAQEVIAQIKRLTDKPVNYLVITHFHGDHFQGSEAYVKEWPQIQIISSPWTRNAIETIAIPRMHRELVTVPLAIGKVKAALEKENDSSEKARLQKQLSEGEAYLSELNRMVVSLPNVTFEGHLNIHDGNDELQVLFLGRGHTNGDVFVYDPKTKVLASGDALTAWVPTLMDASLIDWIQQLKKVEALDINFVIGGHGDVLVGKDAAFLWSEYLTDLLAETSHAVAQGASLDEAKKEIIPSLLSKYASRFPTDFTKAVVGNVESAYRVVNLQM